MNTTENNILIAEFMGLELRDKTYFIANSELKPVMGIIGKTSNELLFHCSWNWLMPVIGRCEEIRLNSKGSETHYDRMMETIMNRLIQLDILSTFKNVVEFIKWYNENK